MTAEQIPARHHDTATDAATGGVEHRTIAIVFAGDADCGGDPAGHMSRYLIGCGHTPPCSGWNRLDFAAIAPPPAELTAPGLSWWLSVTADAEEAELANRRHRLLHPELEEGHIAHIPADVAETLRRRHGHHCARDWCRQHWGTAHDCQRARLEPHPTIPAAAVLELATIGGAPTGILRRLAIDGFDIIGAVTASAEDTYRILGYGPGYWGRPAAIEEAFDHLFITEETPGKTPRICPA